VDEWSLGMKASAVAILSLLMVLLFASFPIPRASGICTLCWAPTSPPVYVKLGAYSSFQVAYISVMNSDVTGIVFVVIHNYLNQTVEISTATLQLAPTAYGDCQSGDIRSGLRNIFRDFLCYRSEWRCDFANDDPIVRDLSSDDDS
jgi:hypothetical protein